MAVELVRRFVGCYCVLAMEPAASAPAPFDFPTVRRFCIRHPRPLTPGSLMREFRVTYSHAARLLEELERDRVLRRMDGPAGQYTTR